MSRSCPCTPMSQNNSSFILISLYYTPYYYVLCHICNMNDPITCAPVTQVSPIPSGACKYQVSKTQRSLLSCMILGGLFKISFLYTCCWPEFSFLTMQSAENTLNSLPVLYKPENICHKSFDNSTRIS